MCRRLRRLAPLGAAVALLLSAGCGTSAEEEVEQVTRDFVFAVIDGKWERACELLTAEARAGLERIDGGTTCVRAMELSYGLDERQRRALRQSYDFEVVAVQVEDDEAEVRLREAVTPDGSGVTALRQQDGEWRIGK